MIVLSSKKNYFALFAKTKGFAFTYDPRQFTEKSLRENFFPTRNAVDRFQRNCHLIFIQSKITQSRSQSPRVLWSAPRHGALESSSGTRSLKNLKPRSFNSLALPKIPQHFATTFCEKSLPGNKIRNNRDSVIQSWLRARVTRDFISHSLHSVVA